MNDQLLRSIVDAIKYDHSDPNFVVMDQIYTIHCVISRTAFFLTHKQMEYIHAKFKNLFKIREAWLEAEVRSKAPIAPPKI